MLTNCCGDGDVVAARGGGGPCAGPRRSGGALKLGLAVPSPSGACLGAHAEDNTLLHTVCGLSHNLQYDGANGDKCACNYVSINYLFQVSRIEGK